MCVLTHITVIDITTNDPGRLLMSNHTTCPQCRLAAGFCQLDASHPCKVSEAWPKRTWSKLMRSFCDAKAGAVQRGRQ